MYRELGILRRDTLRYPAGSSISDFGCADIWDLGRFRSKYNAVCSPTEEQKRKREIFLTF